jgi:hypothetical protein
MCFLCIVVQLPPGKYALAVNNNNNNNIATRYELDGPRIKSRWRQDFPHPSRPTLGPTQPSMQCVPGFFPGNKTAGA